MVAPPSHHIRTSHSSPGLIDPESLSSSSRYLACSLFHPSTSEVCAIFPQIISRSTVYTCRQVNAKDDHQKDYRSKCSFESGVLVLPSLLIPRKDWIGHDLSSCGGIFEMFHSCRRPSRQLPLRLRWSIYWRRGGRQQPFILVLYTLCLGSILYT